jgi:hypothetical protein
MFSRLTRMVRFSLQTVMMLVITAAAASALYAKIRLHTTVTTAAWKFDGPSLFLLAIFLTALPLAAWQNHSAFQTMLQITLACLGCLTLIWIGEAQYERLLRYWFQTTFAGTVTLPLFARRLVKNQLPRGPRRDWWKKTCEAVFFSFLNLMLVAVGGLTQVLLYQLGSGFLKPVGP